MIVLENAGPSLSLAFTAAQILALYNKGIGA